MQVQTQEVHLCMLPNSSVDLVIVTLGTEVAILVVYIIAAQNHFSCLSVIPCCLILYEIICDSYTVS